MEGPPDGREISKMRAVSMHKYQRERERVDTERAVFPSFMKRWSS
jgi:hypothetical protein